MQTSCLALFTFWTCQHVASLRAESETMYSQQVRRLGPHVSARQRELLVSFVEEHPYLAKASCVLGQQLTAARKEELWQQVTALLNAEGPAVKTAAQWRGVWKEDVYNARRDAAALHAESSGTGGGSLPGPRGRILSLVGRASAIGVCQPFFEPDEEEQSAADRGAGDAASAESHVSVGTAPGTSGIRARPLQPATAERYREDAGGPSSQTQPQQGADDLLSSVVGKYAESVALSQQHTNQIQDLLQSVQQLGTAVENQGAATLRQAVATERLASAAEQQVQQNTQLLQELWNLTRMAPALLLCIQQAMGMPPQAPPGCDLTGQPSPPTVLYVGANQRGRRPAVHLCAEPSTQTWLWPGCGQRVSVPLSSALHRCLAGSLVAPAARALPPRRHVGNH
ncbi:uncharacterized protein [Dermacentor albipictus]|uniref:uncharacterized protein n=1 Tax=Dermacentor albipictus TaxID=60249 RepID=UPI0038FC5436